ncbi:hypothetical protein [Marinifilum fragile]|uniref:hypothetical protein n=1 Tax=Marinifilum fragile TaxID=570161 RepID=UPI0006D28D01|nr:hypothetical protein [Marinifilum fragile]
MNLEMERSDIDFEKYVVCSAANYRSVDGTMKRCIEFRDDQGVLYLAPREDVLKLKEVPKNTYETYALRYDKPYADGVIYSKETVDIPFFERMKQRGIIVDFVLDEVGVKVIRLK